jgi:dCMP deaminase
MDEKWDRRFLELSELISTWSKDDSTKVGCVITTADRRIISTGYNGIPRNLSDDKEKFPERWDRNQHKYAFFEHAERNAIYNAAYAGVSLRGATLYTSLAPCMDCVRGIIQSGIRRVVWDKQKTAEYASTRRLDLSQSKSVLEAAEIIVDLV